MLMRLYLSRILSAEFIEGSIFTLWYFYFSERAQYLCQKAQNLECM